LCGNISGKWFFEKTGRFVSSGRAFLRLFLHQCRPLFEYQYNNTNQQSRLEEEKNPVDQMKVVAV
jgi:hypothetical protein